MVLEKVVKMGYERNVYFNREANNGRWKSDDRCRKKEGEKFEQLACWRLSLLDRRKWECLNGILEKERTISRKSF
jgi:hypothetical protein